MADEFPRAEVIAIDIAPIQPRYVLLPNNVPDSVLTRADLPFFKVKFLPTARKTSMLLDCMPTEPQLDSSCVI